MKRSFITAGALYLMALPGLAIVVRTTPNWFMGVLPIVLTMGSIHVGLALGPRVGFRSLIQSGLSGERATGLGSGLVYATVGAIILALLWVIPARVLIDAGIVEKSLLFPESISVGKLIWIGGVLEELIYRWGGMGLGVFLLWKWLGRDSEKPSVYLYWIVLVLTAAPFGVGHLLRVWHVGGSAIDPYGLFYVVLASIAGMVFGWVFWKKGLEFAILTHGLTNLVILALSRLM